MSDKTAATTYAKLRAETATMLGFGEATLTAVQAMRVDVVTALRLGLDDLSGRLAAGERVDLGKLLEASEALQKFLPENVTAPPSPGGPDGLLAARKRMFELMQIAENDPDADARQWREMVARNAALEAENKALREQLEARPLPLPAPAPAPPPSPPASANVVPILREPGYSPVVVSENYGSSLLSNLNRRAY